MADTRQYVNWFLKGLGIGAANVIPGVSGGTIALITGIFERLVKALKSFDLKAVRLLFSGRFKDFAAHIDLVFLVAVFAGVGVSILSLARLLEYLFKFYPVYTWAFFFGLILASVYFVGRTIEKINLPVVLSGLVGVIIAVGISYLSPANANDSPAYLFLSGIVAVCSMILPGLSGSFVLILMGNYELIFIHAVNRMDIGVLLPVVLGAVVGLLAFSHFLSWLLNKFRNQTIALLTGFIFGSLNILWPWKNAIYKLDTAGHVVTKADGTPVIAQYRKFMPDNWDHTVFVAFTIMVIGFLVIWVIEYYAGRKTEKI
ncbi:MAG: DUF368 domain-containing protein [Chlorobi bacterium]|nr:DUF368 domain-containing protein [Chlorobiota bacterium]